MKLEQRKENKIRLFWNAIAVIRRFHSRGLYRGARRERGGSETVAMKKRRRSGTNSVAAIAGSAVLAWIAIIISCISVATASPFERIVGGNDTNPGDYPYFGESSLSFLSSAGLIE